MSTKAQAQVSWDRGATWSDVEIITVATKQDGKLDAAEITKSILVAVGPELPAAVIELQEEIERLKDVTAALLVPPPQCTQCQRTREEHQDKRLTHDFTQGPAPALVFSDAEFKNWGETLKKAKGNAKKIDEARQEVTRPLMTLRDMIIDRVRPFTEEGLLVIAANIEKALVLCRTERRRRDDEASRQAQLALTAKREDGAVRAAATLEAQGRPDAAARVLEQVATTPAPPMRVNTVPEVKGVTFRGKWLWEIEDPNAIPREYLSIDRDKILQRINSFGVNHGISGILAWWDEDSSTIVRSEKSL